jgi:hypothetical protein
MPNPDLMKDLEADLENALEAKDAQKLMDYINKVRNEQKKYDSDTKMMMEADDGMGESEANRSKARDMDPAMLDSLIDKAEDALMDLPSE